MLLPWFARSRGLLFRAVSAILCSRVARPPPSWSAAVTYGAGPRGPPAVPGLKKGHFKRFSGSGVDCTSRGPSPSWAFLGGREGMKKGRRPRRRPPLKFSEKRRGSVPVLPGERAGFPLKIAGFLALSRPVPVYPVFLKYVVPVHRCSAAVTWVHLFYQHKTQKSTGFDKSKPVDFCV